MTQSKLNKILNIGAVFLIIVMAWFIFTAPAHAENPFETYEEQEQRQDAQDWYLRQRNTSPLYQPSTDFSGNPTPALPYSRPSTLGGTSGPNQNIPVYGQRW